MFQDVTMRVTGAGASFVAWAGLWRATLTMQSELPTKFTKDTKRRDDEGPQKNRDLFILWFSCNSWVSWASLLNGFG
jgi:hypothetical protein